MIMFKFEFNDRKSISNLRKHGVSFEEAISCFSDELSIEFYDEAHSRSQLASVDEAVCSLFCAL